MDGIIAGGVITSILSGLLSVFSLKKNRIAETATRIFLFLTWISVTVFITWNWLEQQRPPFKTLTESLVLLAWCTSFIGIISITGKKKPWIWLIISLSGTAIFFYLFLNPASEKIMLPPALQSIWFIPHVVVYFLGYGSLAIGSAGLAGSGIIKKWLKKTDEDTTKLFSIRLTRAGYLLLTTGLVLGAVWADEAWGVYWGWDQKESWALITFFVYTAFFHLKPAQQQSRMGTTVLIAGLFTIAFTYLGMHLLPNAEMSMHTYQ